MKKIVAGIVAAASLASASPALADPITLDSSDVGSSFTINFDGFANEPTNVIADLTSSITFTLDSIVGDFYNFSYLVDNTTSGGLDSRISSFAFNVDPDIIGASSTGTYPFSFVADGSGNDPRYPNQIGAVDVCFKAKSSGSCSNGDGVTAGNTGSGTLALEFQNAVSSITLSDFYVRYQSITGAGGVTSASGKSITSTTTTSSSGGTPVPAPGMLALFAIALGALGFMRRRRDTAMPAFA